MSTVRIRVRVCVDHLGNYNAAGSGTMFDHAAGQFLDDEIADGMPGSRGTQGFHWVEADVPLPVVESVIAGEVAGDA